MIKTRTAQTRYTDWSLGRQDTGGKEQGLNTLWRGRQLDTGETQ